RSIRLEYLRAGRPYVKHKDDKGKISVSFPSTFGDISGALDVMGEQWGAADKGKFESAMKAKGVQLGDPVMFQVYKIPGGGGPDEDPSVPKMSESLENGYVALYMKPRGQDRFVHVINIPICLYSGTLGPKTSQGDLQMPEGFFVVTPNSPRGSAKYKWSFDVGHNQGHTYVKRHGHSGSAIMGHGKCKSVGCWAVGDNYIDWIRDSVNAALRRGQSRIHIMMMPFAPTEANLARYADSPHINYWREQLKPAYDRFMQTGVPEDVYVCGLGKRARYTLKSKAAAGQSCATVDGISLSEEVVADVAAGLPKAKARALEPIDVVEPVATTPVMTKFVINDQPLNTDQFGLFQRCMSGTTKAGETCVIEPTKIFACVTINGEAAPAYSLWTADRVVGRTNCAPVEAAQFQFK
ncbi:MAG: hypothetical protein EBQ96_09325, partial [Proteobacteria bacterium]|nr:hypothetical protein [Pseudomonadota bacterium]